MQVNIWNIYHRLSYPNKIPLVKDGGATIKGVRWIVSKDLNPDMVYIGREAEFFAAISSVPSYRSGRYTSTFPSRLLRTSTRS